MKMAKASAADLDMAMDIANVLDDIERGFFPTKLQSDEDAESEQVEWIETAGHQQYDRLIFGLQKLLNKGSISRVIWGMAVVCDPSNECIDPDSDTIEHHPKRQQLEEQCDAMKAVVTALQSDQASRIVSMRLDDETLIRVTKQRDELAADRDTWKARAEFSYQQRDVLEGRVESLVCKLSDHQRQAAIGKAIERACEELPEGFDIRIECEKGAATVRLYDSEGDEDPEDLYTDSGFGAEIDNAINIAIAKGGV